MRFSLRQDGWLFLFLILQGAFWWQMREVPPAMGIVPEPPTERALKAQAFGDPQFLFRTYALQLQNFGDTFGRATPLKDYDYGRLERWFNRMDALDARSHFIPSLASYYFGQTQDVSQLPHVIRYLEEHGSRDLGQKWWWLAQAVYLAKHKLEDKKWALKLAYKLAEAPGDDVPIWTRQMPAFIHEELGEKEAAYAIIRALLDDADNLDEGELNFMRYFIEERLKRLEEDRKQQEKAHDR